MTLLGYDSILVEGDLAVTIGWVFQGKRCQWKLDSWVCKTIEFHRPFRRFISWSPQEANHTADRLGRCRAFHFSILVRGFATLSCSFKGLFLSLPFSFKLLYLNLKDS